MTTTQQAVNQPVKTLPAFEEVIKIEVPVQSIYEKLMEQFPNDYKHREILAHAIIGGTPNLSYLYNAMNGYTNDIDFEVGDIVMCTEESRKERYDANIENEKGERAAVVSVEADTKPNWRYRDVAIGRCKVIKINLYQSDKLVVEFEGWNRYNNRVETMTTSVNHKTCTKVPVYANH